MSELAHDRFAIVSSDTDQLILVNSQDEAIGTADKLLCHDGEGILHRAFSILLFNTKGELLLQQRASAKRLWGGFWSNTCCSHPREGENMADASVRRLWEELGIKAKLHFLYKFEYHAQFGDEGAEHELCWVYVGISDDEPSPNANEVSDWRYLSMDDLECELAMQTDAYTPWFKMEWQVIKQQYATRLAQLIAEQ